MKDSLTPSACACKMSGNECVVEMKNWLMDFPMSLFFFLLLSVNATLLWLCAPFDGMILSIIYPLRALTTLNSCWINGCFAWEMSYCYALSVLFEHYTSAFTFFFHIKTQCQISPSEILYTIATVFFVVVVVLSSLSLHPVRST